MKCLWVSAVLCISLAQLSWAGSIFLTGHDPDFHAYLGGNTTGARNINNAAIGYVTDPLFNPFNVAGAKFLFVESTIAPPSGHVDGVNGIVASGYTLGVDFDSVNAAGLNAALDNLGTTYDAIVVASDFGGILTQAELDILNARSTDIIAFLNSGGGLYAMAESNLGAGLTPGGGFFDFLPFVATSAQLNQSEVGYTVTPFGAGLGLSSSDVNGNASHIIFDTAAGLNIIDQDSQGNILSLAIRSSTITPGGVAPEPGSMVLAGLGAALLLWRGARARKTR